MIRALTILFALALLWAAVVAVLFVGYADLPDPSLRCVPGTLDRLAARLTGQVSTPGDDGYAAATAIWSKPAGRMPDAVVHCQTPLGLRTQEMLRTSSLLAEPSALTPMRLWESPPKYDVRFV
jgi:hypothetical protein